MSKNMWGRVARGLHRMADDMHAKKAGSPQAATPGPRQRAARPPAAPQHEMSEGTCHAPRPPTREPTPQTVSEPAHPGGAAPGAAPSDESPAESSLRPSSMDALRLPPPTPPPALRRPSSPPRTPAGDARVDERTEEMDDEVPSRSARPEGPVPEQPPELPAPTSADAGDALEDEAAEQPPELPGGPISGGDALEDEAAGRTSELPGSPSRGGDEEPSRPSPATPIRTPRGEAVLARRTPPSVAPAAVVLPAPDQQVPDLATNAIAQALESLEAQHVRDALHVLLAAQQAIMLEAVQQVRAECNGVAERLTAAVERMTVALERDERADIPTALAEVGEQVRVSIGEVNASLRALAGQNKHIIGAQAGQNERVTAALERLADTAAPGAAAPEVLPKLAVIDGGGVTARHAPSPPSEPIYDRIPEGDLED